MKELTREQIITQDIIHMQQTEWWKYLKNVLEEDLEQIKESIIRFKGGDDDKIHSPAELLRHKMEVLEDIIDLPERIKNDVAPVIKTDSPM